MAQSLVDRAKSAIIFIALFAIPAAASAAEAWEGTVVLVTDGDSVWVKPSDGGRVQKVRLIGIDAPESCQTGGEQARAALKRLVLRQRVSVTSQALDDYGRTLARLHWRGQDVSEIQVRQGWAWSYRWHHDPGPYIDQENEARAAGRGIFAPTAAERPELPRDFRLRHGPCH